MDFFKVHKFSLNEAVLDGCFHLWLHPSLIGKKEFRVENHSSILCGCLPYKEEAKYNDSPTRMAWWVSYIIDSNKKSFGSEIGSDLWHLT